MTRQFLVIPFAYVLGFLAAIPIGASQVEVIKRALARRYSAALLSAAGTVTSDIAYGFLALFGAASFLDNPLLLARLQWAAFLVLVVLACVTWQQSRRVLVPTGGAGWTTGGASYLTGLTIGISYPPIMLSWLAAVALAKGVGLVDSFSPALGAGFVLAGGAGLFSYMVVVTLVVRRTHHFFSERTVRRVYQGLAVLLLVIALGILSGGAFRR